jgi:hypothetical protein
MMCLASLLVAGAASAQQPQPQDQPAGQAAPAAMQPDKPKMGMGACKADVDQFCKGVEKGKIGACLRQHEADLSDTCKDALKRHARKRMMEARKETMDACKADVDQFCKDAEKGKIGDCLKQHKDELSADCKAARQKMHRMHERMEKQADKAQEAASAPQPTTQPAQQ